MAGAKVAKNSNLLGKGRLGGRAKGTPNKTTIAAKDAIAFAAAGLGGAQRLVDWAKEDPKNESAFWISVYPKLLPLQIQGDAENPLQAKVTVEFIGVKNAAS